MDHQAGPDEPGAVAIGLGDPNPEEGRQSVILNHKGYRGARLTSVSEFVGSAPAELWVAWRRRLPNRDALRTLVVEDYSLDTCFAWLLFLARLDGSPVSPAEGYDEAAWIDYVTAWEQGRFVDVDAETSPACLFTTYGHALLPVDGADAAPGFERCLGFLREIVAASPTPSAGGLPPEFASEARRQALAQVAFDRQQYEAALRRGTTFQLLLPSSLPGAAPRRLTIVDALAIEETDLTGILKIMARTDRHNAWTKAGFAVLASHRPRLKGSGNDMTVSVDPARHLTLRSLWRRLEEFENERWGDDRPRDRPRRLESYTAADGTMAPGAPNEPWYDEGGRYTLIAAPKDGGSRLAWDDVLDTLWDEYFLHHIVQRIDLDTRPDVGGRNIHVVRWRASTNPSGASSDGRADSSDSELILPDSPSFHAWLAALTAHDQPTAVRRPTQLPSTDSFEIVAHAAGYCVVTRSGVSIFHDATSTAGDELTGVAEQVGTAARSYRDFLARTSPLVSDWVERLAGGRVGTAQGDDAERWEHDASLAKVEVLRTDARMALLPATFDAEQLRISLERMWGLHERREEARVLIDRLDQLMRDAIAHRTEHRERIYGSLVSAAALAIAIGQLWGPIAALNGFTDHALQLTTIGAHAFGFGLGLGLFWLLGVRRA
jgi:hypothetical protein